jgi:hypothetical protein
MKRVKYLLLFLVLISFGCNLPGRSTGTVNTPTSNAGPAIPSTPKPINLTHLPLYWFAPLPPQPGGPYNGSDDFMRLFTSDTGAEWDQTSSYLQVFKLYGGWAVRDSTIPQLKAAVETIRQNGFALAVEVGPLNPTSDCGFQIEGFAGEEGIQTLKRIQSAGGNLNFIAFDEPYFYGHFYDGERACHWPADKIAKDIDSFIKQAHVIFPNVIIGDIEPVTGPANAVAYNNWLDTFRAVNGYDPGFLHLDVDWGDTKWPQKILAIEKHGDELGIPTGIIYTGNFQDKTDEAWVSIAGERVKRYELESGGKPDHVVFQSWNDKPDRVLPEYEPFTFTNFIKTYFENKSGLGFSAERSGNLALNKPVKVSRQIDAYEGKWAVDGDPGTSWSSGDGPQQWIEIDLGAGYDIQEISLLPSQYPAGSTVHRILGKGPGTDGKMILLYTFEGQTSDSQTLTYKPPQPWKGIQYIRIETVTSPSWVAWREIQISGAE